MKNLFDQKLLHYHRIIGIDRQQSQSGRCLRVSAQERRSQLRSIARLPFLTHPISFNLAQAARYSGRPEQGIPRASEVAERSDAVDEAQDNRRLNVLLSAWMLVNGDAGVMTLHATWLSLVVAASIRLHLSNAHSHARQVLAVAPKSRKI
ncbi:hypothetical protein M2336_001238 [Sphingobium sp. B1D7B]|nr:hypothetical protein [Sphingobium sp. B1D7B]